MGALFLLKLGWVSCPGRDTCLNPLLSLSLAGKGDAVPPAVLTSRWKWDWVTHCFSLFLSSRKSGAHVSSWSKILGSTEVWWHIKCMPSTVCTMVIKTQLCPQGALTWERLPWQRKTENGRGRHRVLAQQRRSAKRRHGKLHEDLFFFSHIIQLC